MTIYRNLNESAARSPMPVDFHYLIAPSRRFDYEHPDGCLGVCRLDKVCPFLGCPVKASALESKQTQTLH